MHKEHYTTIFGGNLPLPLKEIPGAPRQLFVKGDWNCCGASDLKIAIVGTRKATPVGLTIARQLARELAGRGVVVVSGLALGIDQAAHRGCLEAGGRTVAVLASGLDEIYPRQHYSLSEDIIHSGGAIISEYAAGTPPYPNQFLERNRIVSGLCRGVIIVEAPYGSGALNTAAHALEQNREVFVVPGAVTSGNYAGSNDLIKQGAVLITSAKDVLDHYGIATAVVPRPTLPNLNPEQKKIFEILRFAAQPVTADKLADLTQLDVASLNQNLTNLLIEGLVNESGGRYFVI